MNPIVKRALISVTDKEGLDVFARGLRDLGIEIITTGGTEKYLTEHGIDVRTVYDVTGFEEILGGRVKTLHPKIYGGILACRDNPSDQATIQSFRLLEIDMVVCNLYAFENTVADPKVPFADAIENIDIGGPSMVRAAAKNHKDVAIVMNPDDYGWILDELRENEGATTLETRQRLAFEAFDMVADYDDAISHWLFQRLYGRPLPSALFMVDESVKLRYGENSHQSALLHTFEDAEQGQLALAIKIQGKDMGSNNWLDADAACKAVDEFKQKACAIIKHQTVCGLAIGQSLAAAYRKAYRCDPTSAFGGVMAFNRRVDAETVRAIFKNGQFVEVLVAPDYTQKALELLEDKPDIRVLATWPGEGYKKRSQPEYRSIDGGIIEMEADHVDEDPNTFTFPTICRPTEAQLEEALFAWKAAKSVKSNAIVVTDNGATVGIGTGQPNRVDSAMSAVKRAGNKAEGAVAASDAFLPFADTLQQLAFGGVKVLIQPGGSVRDAEVIAAADAAGMAMIFTGKRHFLH
jgi:phosphoribosylaminoimidazolecarboxamide formyltransferase/IMP cyclohydrolase